MIFKAVNRSEFELRILGYLSPEVEQSDYYDWLLIHIVARRWNPEWEYLEVQWDTVDSCFLDVNASQSLCEWFHALSDGDNKPLYIKAGILEDLNFRVIDFTTDHITMKTDCRFYKLVPSRKIEEHLHQIRSSFIYQIEREQFRQATHEWCAEVEQFPMRIDLRRRKR